MRLLAMAMGLSMIAAAGAEQGTFAAGAWHGLVAKAGGTLWGWGSDGYDELGTGEDAWELMQVPGLGDVRAVAAGASFTLVLKADGTVWWWGRTEQGSKAPKPSQVMGLPRITALVAARNHAMALDADGAVWEWGDVPNRSALLAPTRVPNLEKVVKIAAGEQHSIALDSAGMVWVWGDHGAGDLGDGCYGVSAVPQRVPGMTNVVAVAGGYQLTLAVRKDGAVWAMGYGAAGQLGNGKTENSTKPAMVPGFTGVKALAAGNMHVLALKNDGTVWSWGSNHERQLGVLKLGGNDSTKPVRVSTLAGVTAIAAAANHSAALTADGTVWTWGDNSGGALGADPELLERADAPMRVGSEIPGKCETPLFSCGAGVGKVIRICADSDEKNNEKYTNIQYRFGPEYGAPELMFPGDPSKTPPALYFWEWGDDRAKEWMHTVRFTNGAYTYKVYYGEKSGGGVLVEDAKGKIISDVGCTEKPLIYIEYLKMNLPCDPKNPKGEEGCRKMQRSK